MELSKGYKETEIGILPEDWEIDIIENISHITTGNKNTQDRNESGSYPFFVRSMIIERINSFSFEGEAVLVAGDGVGVGKVIHYINGRFDCHQRVYRISEFTDNISGYFFYLYFNSHFLNRIMQMTAKSSVDSVRLEMITKMPIPIPPKPEQTAIATALRDIDQLISTTKSLIEKKKAIKTATMQQLLTPKDDWVEMKLGDVAEIKDGTHQTPRYTDSGIPFYSVENVTNDEFQKTKFISFNEHNFLTKNFKIEKGDLLMTRIGSIGVMKYIDWDVNASFYVSLALIKIKQMIHPKFLYFYSQTEVFKNEIHLHSLQHAVPQKINLGPISHISLCFPNLQIQELIINSLSLLDEEIKNLINHELKYQSIKQGMMQNLLTGKIRLI